MGQLLSSIYFSATRIARNDEDVLVEQFAGSAQHNKGRTKDLTVAMPRQRLPSTRSFPFRSPLARPAVFVVNLLTSFLLAPSVLDVLCFRGAGKVKVDGGMFAAAAVVDAAVCTPAAQTLEVSSSTLNISSLFNCSDGNFQVTWSGVVNVTESIKIGNGTTVSITGDYISDVVDPTGGHSTSSTEAAIINSGSSAAVASNNFGPVFVVIGGALSLDRIAVHNGRAGPTIGDAYPSGGGIYAMYSNITVNGCAFEGNYAESEGGGIFANHSRVEVRDTAFRKCQAGPVPKAGDEDVTSTGGGITVWFTDLLVDRCLFDGCFASNKGGGVHVANGKFSMLKSTFVNNTAGSDNVESEDPYGEGGDLDVSACVSSFDNAGACGVNDSLFAHGFVAKKGGSVALADGTTGPSYVEFHRCKFHNSTAGIDIEDDPQGEGGVFSVGSGTTLVVVDSMITEAYAGKKGGAIAISSGNDWVESPGGIVTLYNSTFANNIAVREAGGVIYCNEYTNLTIAGRENDFLYNECGTDGAVLAATTNTAVSIEGGNFTGNSAEETSGVFWSKGNVAISDGLFVGNKASDGGGVFSASEFGVIVVEGGTFGGNNEADDGGVGFVSEGSQLFVNGGNFFGNTAKNGGGAFYAQDNTSFVITGGIFDGNRADFGGFLYKEGEGDTSCTGASIMNHDGVDGGAIYAVDGAVLVWNCDLGMNWALVGPAIYVRDEADVTLQDVTLYDNGMSRGSVIFVTSGILRTYQVVFNDSSGSPDLSAIQADEESSYFAESTSFVGFAGEAVIFSEGILYLDNCDFSESNASVLVFSANHERATVRNTILGDKNYEGPALAAHLARELPTADGIINVKLECEDVEGNAMKPPPCEASACVEGDIGVYCQCYIRKSDNETTCTANNPVGLSLAVHKKPETTFSPNLLEGDLLLSYRADDITGGNGSNSSTYSGAATGEGVVWNASAVSSDVTMSWMNWTVFPSNGLLLPGENITLRVASKPSTEFDGSAKVTFRVDAMSFDTEEAANVLVTSSPSSSSSLSTEALIDVEFFHCGAGSFWNSSSGAENPSDGCKLCTDAVVGDVEGLDCSKPGASTKTLPIKNGYWRASLGVVTIRECFKKDACVGGSNVANVSEYCGDGYEGPFCAVCESGYGRGSSNGCHKCTTSFKGGMFSLMAFGALALLVMATLLTAYLLGGVGAVTATITSAKESVSSVRRRGSDLLSASIASTKSGARGGATGETRSWGSGSTSAQVGGGRMQSAITGYPRIRSASVGAASPGTSTHSSSFPQPRRGQRRGESSSASGQRMDSIRGLILLSDQDDNDPVGDGHQLAAEDHDGSGVGIDKESIDVGHHFSHQGEKNDDDDDDVAAGVVGGYEGTVASSSHREGRVGLVRTTGRWDAAGQVPSASGVGGLGRSCAGSGTKSGRLPDIHPIRSGSRKSAVPKSGDETGQGDTTSLFGRIWRLPAKAKTPTEEESDQGTTGGNKGAGAAEAEKGKKKSSVAKKIGVLRRTLPLSKLKIVIVVWQISAAFAEITQVPLPPLYEKFLTVIGIFTFDLGWMFSAACLTPGLNFYDQLLIVTIGPLILLALLGVTFYVGARRSRALSPTNEDQDSLSGSRRSSFFHNLYRAQGISWSTGIRQQQRRQHRRAVSSFVEDSPDGLIPSKGSSSSRGKRGSAGRSTAEDGHDEPLAPALRLSESLHQHPEASGSRPFEGGASQSRRSFHRIQAPGPEGDPGVMRDRLWGLFSRHTTIVLVIFYLVYSSVSTVVFQTFACQSLPEVNKRYLRADFTIECDTPEHRAYKVYAIFMILLYPFGIPGAFLFFLFRQRSGINPPVFFDKKPEGVRREDELREKMEKRQQNQTVAPTSFLWGAYYPDRHYYEVCECIRRLLLTGLLVFMVPYSTGQVAISCIFAFLSLVWFELLRPFVDPVDMQLYRTGCLVIFFSNFLALMIKAEVAHPNSSRCAVFSVALIAVNIMLFLSVFSNAWAAARVVMSKENAQDAVFGFEIVAKSDVDAALNRDKGKGGDGQTDARELEEMEAAPAWERQQTSTVDGMNLYSRHLSLRGNNIVAGPVSAGEFKKGSR